jgi:hypothetical protein
MAVEKAWGNEWAGLRRRHSVRLGKATETAFDARNATQCLTRAGLLVFSQILLVPSNSTANSTPRASVLCVCAQLTARIMRESVVGQSEVVLYPDEAPPTKKEKKKAAASVPERKQRDQARIREFV